LENFWWLLKGGLKIPLNLWPVTALLLLFVATTSISRHLNEPAKLYIRQNLQLFLLFIFPFIYPLIGSIFWETGHDYIPTVILLVQMSLILYLFYKLDTIRRLTLSLAFFTLWLSLGAAFISVMAVKGEWL
jgi:hypothetical protein